MEDGRAQEICNRISNNIVKRMGPNKTIKSISRVCKATGGIKKIIENCDMQFSVSKRSVKHKTTSSVNDELQMIQDLISIQPFVTIPGRAHDSFPELKRSPLMYLDPREFRKWLTTHKAQIANHKIGLICMNGIV